MTRLSSCICPGYEAVFECIVTGGGATTWNGTAFETCSNGNEIVLRHSIFNQSGWSQYCGDSGPIIVHTVSVMNETFTSQLVVNVSQSLNGTNVECSSSSGSRVGTKQIQLTTGAYNHYMILLCALRLCFDAAPLPWPPPSNVILSQINSAHLTFTWNPVAPNCQAVHYEINVINCGQCPNTTSCGIIITCPISTDTNSVSCSINAMLNALPETCAIILQPVVCGSVYGNSSIFNVKDLCNNTCSDEGSNHNVCIIELSGSESDINHNVNETSTQVTIGEGDGSPYPHTSTGI